MAWRWCESFVFQAFMAVLLEKRIPDPLGSVPAPPTASPTPLIQTRDRSQALRKVPTRASSCANRDLRYSAPAASPPINGKGVSHGGIHL